MRKKVHQTSTDYVSDTEQLRFYALFQQTVRGPCREPEPPIHQQDALDKWRAHRALGGMTKHEAEEFYEEMLKETPTCLLLDKIYDAPFVDRKLVPSHSALCTFGTDHVTGPSSSGR